MREYVMNVLIKSIIPVLFLKIGVLQSQSVSDLKFNEVLVQNDSLNVDDFGEHSAWIEIFNSGYNTVDLGGCYLTNDLSNPTKYWIPTGDPTTKIPSRCYLLFWADGKPSRGILHLNFDLKNSKELALFDASGSVLIDKLSLPNQHFANKSYGYMESKSATGEMIGYWKFLDDITPVAHNDHTRKSSSGEQFVKHDPNGLGMALVAMSVVFFSLALLYLVFKNIGVLFMRKNKAATSSKKTQKVNEDLESQYISGEISAAIAMSIHFYQNEYHDDENMVLTIKKISRAYSPWSSKIYTLRKYPQ